MVKIGSLVYGKVEKLLSWPWRVIINDERVGVGGEPFQRSCLAEHSIRDSRYSASGIRWQDLSATTMIITKIR